jgi:hypothetical protein
MMKIKMEKNNRGMLNRSGARCIRASKCIKKEHNRSADIER